MPNPRSLLPKGAKLASNDFAQHHESVMPFDVRKASGFPKILFLFERLHLEEEVGVEPQRDSLNLNGEAEPFRTSGGKASTPKGSEIPQSRYRSRFFKEGSNDFWYARVRRSWTN